MKASTSAGVDAGPLANRAAPGYSAAGGRLALGTRHAGASATATPTRALAATGACGGILSGEPAGGVGTGSRIGGAAAGTRAPGGRATRAGAPT